MSDPRRYASAPHSPARGARRIASGHEMAAATKKERAMRIGIALNHTGNSVNGARLPAVCGGVAISNVTGARPPCQARREDLQRNPPEHAIACRIGGLIAERVLMRQFARNVVVDRPELGGRRRKER